jgi:hypothetical protein
MPESLALMTQPSTIAHNRIVSKLGESGIGAVYWATDAKLNRDVAIKVLLRERDRSLERGVRGREKGPPPCNNTLFSG